MGEFTVITGCDSGIGRELRNACIRQGQELIASTVYPSTEGQEKGLRYLNLLSEESIHAFTEAIYIERGKGKRMASLFLNAGKAAVGPVEHLPMKILREIMEINFFGNYTLVQGLLPAIREDKTRLCLVSSSAGKLVPPYFSPYTCSKFALEALGDSLRRELSPLGIKVIIFEPRAVATPIWETTWQNMLKDIAPKLPKYYLNPLLKGAQAILAGTKNGLSPKAAADFMLRKSFKKHPTPRYIVAKHRVLTYLQLHLPTILADTLVHVLFRERGKIKASVH